MQQISIENNTINAPVIGISSAKNAGMMMFCDVLRRFAMFCDVICILYIKGINGFNFVERGQGGQGGMSKISHNPDLLLVQYFQLQSLPKNKIK
jgi:hypothetical protein